MKRGVDEVHASSTAWQDELATEDGLEEHKKVCDNAT